MNPNIRLVDCRIVAASLVTFEIHEAGNPLDPFSRLKCVSKTLIMANGLTHGERKISDVRPRALSPAPFRDPCRYFA